MNKAEGNEWRWRYGKEWLPDCFSHGLGFVEGVFCQITLKPVTREHIIMLGAHTEWYGDDWIYNAFAIDFMTGAIP